jgi:hypothetical protein
MRALSSSSRSFARPREERGEPRADTARPRTARARNHGEKTRQSFMPALRRMAARKKSPAPPCRGLARGRSEGRSNRPVPSGQATLPYRFSPLLPHRRALTLDVIHNGHGKFRASGAANWASATTSASTSSSLCNMSSSICRPASDNRATSYHGAATINSARIIAAASTILVVWIAVAAAGVATAYNCPPSNDRSTSIRDASPVDCGASMN